MWRGWSSGIAHATAKHKTDAQVQEHRRHQDVDHHVGRGHSHLARTLEPHVEIPVDHDRWSLQQELGSVRRLRRRQRCYPKGKLQSKTQTPIIILFLDLGYLYNSSQLFLTLLSSNSHHNNNHNHNHTTITATATAATWRHYWRSSLALFHHQPYIELLIVHHNSHSPATY